MAGARGRRHAYADLRGPSTTDLIALNRGHGPKLGSVEIGIGMRNLRIGSPGRGPLDKLRSGLLHIVLERLRALNDSTRRLLHLLEADWTELKASWKRGGPDRRR